MKMKKRVQKIGYLGLGKMGLHMVLRLREKGISVVAWNRGAEGRDRAKKEGVDVFDEIPDVIAKLSAPRIVWLMVPSAAVDEVLDDVLPFLSRGDVLIDGGNSYFKDTLRRAKKVEKKGVHFVDAGVSGGPGGARNGACVMVGGERKTVESLRWLFGAAAAGGAFLHAGSHGAGHFVKMVHNGIEYGMMQALAEGFEVLKKSPFKLDLLKVADLYNHKSVIESRLVGWLFDAYRDFGTDLKIVSGTVAHTGEGEWTVKTAKELNVPVPIIEGSFHFRKKSAKNPSYTGKILSALRHEFGGHKANE